MEVSMNNPTDQMNRPVDFLSKKRKIQAEPVGVPLPKHVRLGQILEYDSSSDSTMELPKKICELGAEELFVENSSTSTESTISTCNEDETGSAYMETNSLHGRSTSKPVSGESETIMFDYEADLLEFGIVSDFGYSDYADYKALENLLHSSGIDPTDYILSSRRWSGDQDGGKKLTIDKEFEKCFSMLML
ncbi:protein FAR-RED-ELONGATED HYPOCOTYL 1-LIKE-like [Henckelia pumila]|uniref:protein FAR-RED-ELONGATED HYPOCOTYL 1-LIKE-like n=1 Tax=Henckelia pumila TaxID=405737 RepID=UPI003C6DDF0E